VVISALLSVVSGSCRLDREVVGRAARRQSQKAGIPVRVGLAVTLRAMGSERARRRCLERLDALVRTDGDRDAMRVEAIGLLRTAIGFERWCTLVLDPDTLVLGQGIGHNDWSAELPRLNLLAAGGEDVNSPGLLARSRDPVGVLSAATGGDLLRSTRWRDVLEPYGVGDELLCVATDELGSWGDVILYRDSDDPPFDSEDAQLMRRASSLLARGLRRHAVAPREGVVRAPSGAGVLLLDAGLGVSGWTGAARDWFAALSPPGAPVVDGIPPFVWNVVGRLLALERGDDPGRPATMRARTADGRWAVIEAARLEGTAAGVAVSIRPAGVEDVLGLLSRASGLTPRERALVALLVEGLDTRELAARLFISRHTVQDHLKSVFEKVGVHSRRELVSGVFAQAA
jgi:DNA-binding CsgD family transcriptional regulator